MRWPWSRNTKAEARSEDPVHHPVRDATSEPRRDPLKEAAPVPDQDATPESDGNVGGDPLAHHHHASPTPAVKDSPSMSESVTPESNETAAAETQPSSTPSKVEQAVVEMIKTVYDPEIPIDIYELGLIYEVDVRPESSVYIKMTLTSPMCPVAETLPPEVEEKVRMVEGVADVTLELVWDPPWHPDMMSEAAKLELNM